MSDLVVADSGIGDGREHRGDGVLVTNQVAQKLVEDCRHGVGEDLPVLHAFLGGEREGERERKGGRKGREGHNLLGHHSTSIFTTTIPQPQLTYLPSVRSLLTYSRSGTYRAAS